jgi:hypothetical protein
MANEQDPFARYNIPAFKREDQPARQVNPDNPFGAYNVPKYNEAPPPAAAPAPEVKPEFMKTDRPEAQDRSWSEVPGQMAQNFVPSLKENIHQIVTPFLQPKETAQAIGQLGVGAYSKAKGALGFEQNAEEKAKDEAALNAVGKFYADRYGSEAGFKRALAEDPVGVLSDLSIPFTGGGTLLAKAPGAAGKLGSAVKAAGSVMDPIGAAAQATKAASKGVSFAGQIPQWWATGSSWNSLTKAYEAGLEGNKAFRDTLMGISSAEDGLRRVEAGHAAIAAERAKKIEEMLGDIGDKPMTYDRVQTALQEASQRVAPHGSSINRAGAKALEEANLKVLEFMHNPDIVPNVRNMQNLKVAIRDIMEENGLVGKKTVGENALNHVYNSIKQDIASLDKGVGVKYMEAMDHYAQQTKKLQQINADLIGGRSDASKIRKLLKEQDSVTKQNLLSDLAKYDPDIPYIVAALELKPGLPKGLRGMMSGVGAGIAATGSVVGAPVGIASMALHSPKIMGGSQYTLGYLGGLPARSIDSIPGRAISQLPQQAGRVEELTQNTPRNDAAVQAALDYIQSLPSKGIQRIEGLGIPTQMIRGNAAGGRIGRATGGRTNGMMTAEMLMQAAHAAKKKINKTTEEILNAPDEAVVKALSVAKQHI